MFENTNGIIKIVFENTNCIILYFNLAKSRFFCFFAKSKPIKDEQIHKGHNSHDANDSVDNDNGL